MSQDDSFPQTSHAQFEAAAVALLVGDGSIKKRHRCRHARLCCKTDVARVTFGPDVAPRLSVQICPALPYVIGQFNCLVHVPSVHSVEGVTGIKL